MNIVKTVLMIYDEIKMTDSKEKNSTQIRNSAMINFTFVK